MIKITSRWVPPLLSNQNRADRVRLCREYLAKFRNQSWRLGDVVTGDESWFYWRQIGRKQANASWVGEGESPRTMVRRDRFELKTMLATYLEGVVSIKSHIGTERPQSPPNHISRIA